MEAKEMARLAVAALEDRKAVDVKVINIENISTLADYFIIASGTNCNQVQAMSEAVEEELQKHDIHPKNIEGYQTANWILMDYGDIVLHIFDEENRLFYDIERIWKDGSPAEL
ncbi:MAG: ribosome silencing factor [Eubacterium sp.]|nr:ribosome silencing factor [Eubacterium sp.]